MLQKIRSWLPLAGDRRGVTALEYGMIAALIAVVIIGVITTLGTTLQAKFQAIITGLGG